MVIDADLADLIELLQFPFITGAPGRSTVGPTGRVAGKLRGSAPFFSHTVGHAALLGIVLGYYST